MGCKDSTTLLVCLLLSGTCGTGSAGLRFLDGMDTRDIVESCVLAGNGPHRSTAG
jgi:hypothetical protein